MSEEGKSILFAEETALNFSLKLVECGGRMFQPDDETAYFAFRMSHAFPVVSFYGECVHPNVVAKTWPTLQSQQMNIGHLLKVHDPENIRNDRIIGFVAAAEFPTTPEGGWKIGARAAAPGIRAAGAIFKQAAGVDRIIGAHTSQRKNYTVSMELKYFNEESGFAVQRESTPYRAEGLGPLGDGWDFIPVSAAPKTLLETRDWKKKRMTTRRSDGGYVGKWEKRDAFFMMGGTDGNNRYSGVGIVEHGAEPTATIEQVLAGIDSQDELIERLGERISGVLTHLKTLADTVGAGKF